MSDLKMNTATWDLDVTNGDVSLVTGTEATAQQIAVRLRFFYKEWFLDERQGIPYFRDILIKNPDLDLLRDTFRRTVESTPGVDRVTTMTVGIEKASRRLNLFFRALTDTGEELVFEPFVLDI